MSLLSILNQASVGLNTQQGVSQTASNNISNANTPGYARQTANLATAEPADEQGNVYLGQGVALQSVTQIRDIFVEAQLPSAFGGSSSASAEASTLTSVTALNPNQPGGLSSALSSFYSALTAMSQNPGDPGERSAVVAAAQGLAAAFNQTSQGITSAQDGVDTQLGGLTSQVNSLASQMASLNSQIREASASGASPNDLLDARQQIQDQLEQLTGATPVPDGNGDVNMVLADGTGIVSGDQSAKLSTLPDASNGGHLDVQITQPGTSAAQTLPNATLGGQIGGLLSARDGALKTSLSSLDSFAFDLGNSLNSVQQAGFDLNGNAGQPLFVVGASAAGTAGSISVSSAIAGNPSLLAAASTAAGGSGDASNLQAMINTSNSALPTSGADPIGTLASLTSTYGSAAQSAQNAQAQSTAILGNLQNLRSSASGVSTQAELTTLDQAQAVYQALSKVITATDTMLDALLQIK